MLGIPLIHTLPGWRSDPPTSTEEGIRLHVYSPSVPMRCPTCAGHPPPCPLLPDARLAALGYLPCDPRASPPAVSLCHPNVCAPDLCRAGADGGTARCASHGSLSGRAAGDCPGNRWGCRCPAGHEPPHANECRHLDPPDSQHAAAPIAPSHLNWRRRLGHAQTPSLRGLDFRSGNPSAARPVTRSIG